MFRATGNRFLGDRKHSIIDMVNAIVEASLAEIGHRHRTYITMQMDALRRQERNLLANEPRDTQQLEEVQQAISRLDLEGSIRPNVMYAQKAKIIPKRRLFVLNTSR